MPVPACVVAFALGPILALGPTEPGPHADATTLLSIVDARESLADLELWPDWSPLETPLALSDGETTLLVGHPRPPQGFTPVEGRNGVLRLDHRHPLVTANSSVDLGGVPTATLLIPSDDGRTPQELAALVAHEAFHVHQGRAHPDWSADESQLFLLPVTDGALLGLRRLESLALARALAAEDVDEAAFWAAQALTLRAERDLHRSDGAAGYERSLELWEGLARYVQHRASGDASLPFPSEGGWPAEADRDRAYVSGAALALLLDRLRPDWKRALEEEGGATLDGLLDDVLRGVEPAGFALSEREEVESRALADAANVAAGRRRAAAAFIERDGSAVQVIVADGPVLSPQRFDPLNVRLLEGRLVLHTRLLRLERPGASIEVLGAECLTLGAGSHPLFGGVQSLLLTGLPEDFAPTREGDAVKLTTPGLQATFTRAEVERLTGRPFWRITLR